MRGDLNGKNVITAPHGVRVQDVKALEESAWNENNLDFGVFSSNLPEYCTMKFAFNELFFFVAITLHGLHEMLRACALVAVAGSAAAFIAPQVSCTRVAVVVWARRPTCPRPPTRRVLHPVQNLPSAAGRERGDRRLARPD